LAKKHIQQYEQQLLDYATEQINTIEGIKIYGKAKNKAGVLSFGIKGIHPQDAGIILDNLGIAVRTGHHCAQPLMDCYKIPGTIRASFAMYNTFQEIDTFINGLHKVIKMLGT